MKDQLSALIDGELEIENAEHLIIAAKSTGEMSESWAQYHLIGDAMRGDKSLSADFTKRVMFALENERIEKALEADVNVRNNSVSNISSILEAKHSLEAKQNKQRFSLAKAMPIWSVAASVAAVMFVGYMVLQQNGVSTQLAPIEIAQNIPMEYIQAHQNAAPTNAAYYIQNASFSQPAISETANK